MQFWNDASSINELCLRLLHTQNTDAVFHSFNFFFYFLLLLCIVTIYPGSLWFSNVRNLQIDTVRTKKIRTV